MDGSLEPQESDAEAQNLESFLTQQLEETPTQEVQPKFYEGVEAPSEAQVEAALIGRFAVAAAGHQQVGGGGSRHPARHDEQPRRIENLLPGLIFGQRINRRDGRAPQVVDPMRDNESHPERQRREQGRGNQGDRPMGP